MLLDYFTDIDLTDDQKNALVEVEGFLVNEERAFILKGYAGSGKTTILKGVVKYLIDQSTPIQLLAPTGRAAKVLNERTGYTSSTIHRGIYNYDEREVVKDDETDEEIDYLFKFKIATRDIADTVFIIDEASMISDEKSRQEHLIFGSGKLLNDFITYSKLGDESAKTKVIFVGDPVQLPPIGMSQSPALSEEYLQEVFKLNPCVTTMRQVVRGGLNSGVMAAATRIRKSYTSNSFNSFDISANNKDIFKSEFEGVIDDYLLSETPRIVITWKNKTAHEMNLKIRQGLLGSNINYQLKRADQVVFVKNDYRNHVLNGEFAVVSDAFETEPSITRTITLKKKGGKMVDVKLTWHKADFQVPQNGEVVTVSGYVLENLLQSDEAMLSSDEFRALYVDFRIRYDKLKPDTEEFRDALLSDPFYNAFQVKFGYAVTCHKAQGGEWPSVFVLWDYGITKGQGSTLRTNQTQGTTNADFSRWAYTAITRSSKNLFNVNPPCFHPYSNMSFIASDVQDATERLQKTTSEKIMISDEMLEGAHNHGLSNESDSIKAHFYKMLTLGMGLGVDLIAWKKVNYEVIYTIEYNQRKTDIKFWVNAKGKFNPKYEVIQKDQELLTVVDELVRRVNTTEVVSQLEDRESMRKESFEFDQTTAEEKPFLEELFVSMQSTLKPHGISIQSIDHLEWKERYTLSSKDGLAIIDFEYNAKGFFGRVVPNYKNCSSDSVIAAVEELVCKFKSKG